MDVNFNFLNSNVDGCAEVHSHSLISSHGSEGLKTESKDAPLVKVSFKKTVWIVIAWYPFCSSTTRTMLNQHMQHATKWGVIIMGRSTRKYIRAILLSGAMSRQFILHPFLCATSWGKPILNVCFQWTSYDNLYQQIDLEPIWVGFKCFFIFQKNPNF